MKAYITVMSHLSDAQELTSHVTGLTANKHINFAKYVIIKCDGDLTIDINPDVLWDEFNDKT